MGNRTVRTIIKLHDAIDFQVLTATPKYKRKMYSSIKAALVSPLHTLACISIVGILTKVTKEVWVLAVVLVRQNPRSMVNM
jgi:hypothetical protein